MSEKAIQELLSTAIEQLQSGEKGKLIKTASKMLSLDANNCDANHLLGLANLNSNNYDSAVSYFLKALQGQPKNADIYNNLGNAYQELASPELALEAYQKALTLDQDFSEAHLNIALPLIDLGRPMEAVEACNRAISLKESPDAYNNLGQSKEALGDRKSVV